MSITHRLSIQLSYVRHLCETLVYELNGIMTELADASSVLLEELVDGVVKLVGKLSFNDKRKVIEKLITKIVATKEKITIWGLLPIPSPPKLVYEPEHWHSEVITQLPLELKLTMPPTDKGKRGYSNEFAKRLEQL